MTTEPSKNTLEPTSTTAARTAPPRKVLSRVAAALRQAEREAREFQREARFCNPYDNSPRASDPWTRRDTRL